MNSKEAAAHRWADNERDDGVRVVPAGPQSQPPELAEHERGQPGGEHRVAARRATHRVEEFRPGRGLQQVADRAGFHRIQHVLLLAARGQDQHTRRGMGRAQAAGHLDPGHVRQLQVEHDDVRPGRPDHAQRLRAVGGRRDERDVDVCRHHLLDVLEPRRLSRQHRPPRPERRDEPVVGDLDPVAHDRPGRPRPSGAARRRGCCS